MKKGSEQGFQSDLEVDNSEDGRITEGNNVGHNRVFYFPVEPLCGQKSESFWSPYSYPLHRPSINDSVHSPFLFINIGKNFKGHYCIICLIIYKIDSTKLQFIYLFYFLNFWLVKEIGTNYWLKRILSGLSEKHFFFSVCHDRLSFIECLYYNSKSFYWRSSSWGRDCHLKALVNGVLDTYQIKWSRYSNPFPLSF